MRYLKVVASFLLMLSLCACSSMRNYTMPDEENLLSGAGSMLSVGKDDADDKANVESFEQINLTKLLGDYGLNDVKGASWQDVGSQEVGSQEVGSNLYRYRRNELQDRIIAASNQRCGAYLRTLISSKAQTKMGWAGLATLLSGAASVVSPVSLARSLAAGSTVSNGILSTYNEAYFDNLAINTIVAGITRKRQALLEQLTLNRHDATLVDYPVNRAISDALTYHAACNIISGLETAASATAKVSNSDLVNVNLATQQPAANKAKKKVK